MNKLFLDDVRQPYSDEWKRVSSFKEFAEHLEEFGVPESVSFDHDLAPEHYSPLMYKGEKYDKLYRTFTKNTGLECAEYLVNFCVERGLPLPEEIIVHTANPRGRYNIIMKLTRLSLFHFGEDIDIKIKKL